MNNLPSIVTLTLLDGYRITKVILPFIQWSKELGELLVGNTTPEEQRVIARWTRDALTQNTRWSSGEPYQTRLAALEKEHKRSCLTASRKMNVSVIDTYASFSVLAVSMVVAVAVALVVDAAQTRGGQHTEHVCYSYL
jgi:hypothetical protein